MSKLLVLFYITQKSLDLTTSTQKLIRQKIKSSLALLKIIKYTKHKFCDSS